MIDNLQDIKEILQEENTKEKTETELYNNLVRYLYNIFDNEIKEDLLERGFTYFSYNNVRKDICNEIAGTQEEYNYYFMNYEKALKKVKSFFQEDIKRIETETEKTTYCIKCGEKITINDLFCYRCGSRQTIPQTKIRTKKEKKKHTIFGVNPIIAILLTPIILFFKVLDQTK